MKALTVAILASIMLVACGQPAATPTPESTADSYPGPAPYRAGIR